MTEVMMTKFVDGGKNRRYLVEDALNTWVFGKKFSIIASLIQTTDTRKIQLGTSGMIKLSMLLQKKQSSWVQTYADFSKFLYNENMDISSLFNRCEVIMDWYFEGSLKKEEERIMDLEQGSVSHLIVALRFLQISSENS